MILTNEDLLAISQLLDVKLKAELKPIREDIRILKEKVQALEERVRSLEERVQSLEKDMHAMRSVQESVIIPRLNTIESCYMDTYERYRVYADKIEASFGDIDIMKKVIIGHSEKLQKLA